MCSKCLLKLSGRFSPKSRHPCSCDSHNLIYRLRVHIPPHLLFSPKPALLSGYGVFLSEKDTSTPSPPLAVLKPERDHLACELEPESPSTALALPLLMTALLGGTGPCPMLLYSHQTPAWTAVELYSGFLQDIFF